MLLFLIFLVAGYFGYRWFGWTGVGGAGVLFLAAYVGQSLYRKAREHSNRVKGALLVGTPLSDSEKLHMSNMRERDSRMADRQTAKNKYR